MYSKNSRKAEVLRQESAEQVHIPTVDSNKVVCIRKGELISAHTLMAIHNEKKGRKGQPQLNKESISGVEEWADSLKLRIKKGNLMSGVQKKLFV